MFYRPIFLFIAISLGVELKCAGDALSVAYLRVELATDQPGFSVLAVDWYVPTSTFGSCAKQAGKAS